MLDIIREQTLTVPKEVFEESIEEARRISPDLLDVPYIALALALNVPLTTGDKKLIKGLSGSGVNVVTVRELYAAVVGE